MWMFSICHIRNNNAHTCRIPKAFFGLISLCQVNGSLIVAMIVTQGMATASSIYQLITITEYGKEEDDEDKGEVEWQKLKLGR